MQATIPPLVVHDEHHVSDHYRLWKECGEHFREYFSEFLGTALLVFVVIGFVALMFSTISPLHRLPIPVHVRLLCAGFLIGSVGSLFTISPPGKLSGAHLNPAVSLGFWMLKKMHPRDLGGYIVAQFLGGFLGAYLGKLIIEPAAKTIDFAVLAPGVGVSVPLCFVAELAASLIYFYAIYTCVSHKSTMRYTPLLNVILAAGLVAIDGNISGAGMNPARWFGPAATTSSWLYSWLYFLAPCFAAFAAAGLRIAAPAAGRIIPHTAKLFHDPNFRSVFKHDSVPTTPPANQPVKCE